TRRQRVPHRGLQRGAAARGLSCLSPKHLVSWRQSVREARSESKKQNDPPRDEAAASFLWIIAARTPTTLVAKLKLEASPSWPAGIYLFGDDVLRVGVVIASELPRNRTTLLV